MPMYTCTNTHAHTHTSCGSSESEECLPEDCAIGGVDVADSVGDVVPIRDTSDLDN